ncbi:MAG: DNA gyrase subunit A [Gemmataceae bacterium]
MAETITPVSLRQETEDRYLTYALSVVTARALPDVRDGLKPVQRRILYTMYHDLRLMFDGRPRPRSAATSPATTIRTAPCRPTSAGSAGSRLGGWRSARSRAGQLGSVDGDAPAADRYTEAKPTAVAEALMAERSGRWRCGPTTTTAAKSRSSCPPSFPTCLSTRQRHCCRPGDEHSAHNLGEVAARPPS